MRYLLAIVVALVVTILLAPTAKGHVLLTDETKTKGAILHIVPDDDPIAGKKATLFFDTQQNLLDDAREVTLSVAREGDVQPEVVKTKIDGALVMAEYVFPTQGVYVLRYEIVSSAKTYVFEQATRISRGIAGEGVSATHYSWAEGLLIGSAVFVVALGIVAWNRRKGIAKHSIL